ncbi:MAG: Gfo/Idh/MocA family protein [Nocardioidaceae bacterium]
MKPIRWGIIATGSIAHKLASDIALVPDAELTAVGSRQLETAETFAAQYGARRAYGSYADVAADPDVDVVYVATPHALHRENVELCLAGGKAVLCEKALALNGNDAEAMATTARAAGLFLMEAMWMRCNPNIRALQTLVDGGAVGEVRQIDANFGFVADKPPEHRLYDPALGASALLDIGIYPLTFAWLLLGAPTHISSSGQLSERGIDLVCESVLSYDDGRVARIACSMIEELSCTATIEASSGRIEFAPRFQEAREFTVTTDAGRSTYSDNIRGRGYVHEIEEVHRCLREGRTESSLVPLDETVALMRLMDTIRAQIGSTLPGDDVV